MDAGIGASKGSATGRSALRLCNLVAQSSSAAEGGLQAGGGEGTGGKEGEPPELIYFKVYKSQTPVIEQAIETAARMLGTDKSRGYCFEMISADFLAGAHLENGAPEILLNSISRYYRFLPSEHQRAFLAQAHQKAS